MQFKLDAKSTITIRTARAILLALSVMIALYLVLLPFYPLVKFKLFGGFVGGSGPAELSVAADAPKNDRVQPASTTPTAENKTPRPEKTAEIKDRIIIPKIGVNAPIIVSKSEKYGLNHGAWLVPDTSTPEKGSNTVITGHRFKYLPPNNLTFYLLDKLSVGDEINITWRDKKYGYKVASTKVVPATEVSILEPTAEPTLTVFTCDPIYSTKNRLVVVAEKKK